MEDYYYHNTMLISYIAIPLTYETDTLSRSFDSDLSGTNIHGPGGSNFSISLSSTTHGNSCKKKNEHHPKNDIKQSASSELPRQLLYLYISTSTEPLNSELSSHRTMITAQ